MHVATHDTFVEFFDVVVQSTTVASLVTTVFTFVEILALVLNGDVVLELYENIQFYYNIILTQ